VIEQWQTFSHDYPLYARITWWWTEDVGAAPIDGPAPSAETWEAWAS
jgi:hypothetical protein